jgi:hypothetical protein
MAMSHADVSSNTTQRSPIYLNKKQTNIHAITKLASQAYESSDNPWHVKCWFICAERKLNDLYLCIQIHVKIHLYFHVMQCNIPKSSVADAAERKAMDHL